MKKILEFLFLFVLISCKKDTEINKNPAPSDSPWCELRPFYELIHIGGSGNDYGQSAILTATGEVVITGRTESFGDSDGDLYLVKTDTLGNVKWEKSFGNSSKDEGIRIREDLDGNYLIIGSTEVAGNSLRDIYLIKTDTSGNQVWSTTIGTPSKTDIGADIIPTGSGEYMVLGTTDSSANGLFDLYLAKLDALGNVIWEKKHGGNNIDGGTMLIKESNGYTAFGYTTSFGSGGRDFWILNLDENGDSLSSSFYGGSGYEESQAIVKTSDGGYAMVGHSTSQDPNHDIYVVKVDQNRNLEWEYHLGQNLHDGGQAIIENKNGALAILGRGNRSNTNSEDISFFTVNAQSSVSAEDEIATDNNEAGYALLETKSSYIMIGEGQQNKNGDYDICFVYTYFH